MRLLLDLHQDILAGFLALLYSFELRELHFRVVVLFSQDIYFDCVHIILERLYDELVKHLRELLVHLCVRAHVKLRSRYLEVYASARYAGRGSEQIRTALPSLVVLHVDIQGLSTLLDRCEQHFLVKLRNKLKVEQRVVAFDGILCYVLNGLIANR